MEFIDKKELSKKLKVSISTIDRLMAKGMPIIKIGKTVRFNFDDVLEWLKQNGK